MLNTPLLHGALLALALLGLAACTPSPVPGAGSGSAQAPGVYFHNDVEVFTAIGGGTSGK